MKKSVVSTAMLLALGVSGAANAVQMHGVVMGTLTSLSDTGADKAWAPFVANDKIRLDFWLDSSIVPATHYIDNRKNQSFLSQNYASSGITLKATINGSSRTIHSDNSWYLLDDFMGKDDTDTDWFRLGVTEWGAQRKYRNADILLTFADESTPVLKQLLLGQAVNVIGSQNQVEVKGSTGHFAYQGQVGGKNYDSVVRFQATSFSVAPVPEPETWAMMLLGLGVVGYAARRRAAH